MIWRPDFSGVLHAFDDRWRFQLVERPTETDGEEPQRDRYVRIVRDLIGVAGIDVTVTGALPWQSESGMARAYWCGRVFLAGDAAHQITSYLGLGATTGIQDAYDLAWKLGLVLWGAADVGLLDSYQEEREPVARAAVIASAQACDERGLPRLGGARLVPDPWTALGLGYVYWSRAIADGSDIDSMDEGQPGRRMPHVWLRARDGSRLSTLDLAPGEFALLTGPEGEAWFAAASSLRLPVSVRAFLIGAESLVDESSTWLARAGVMNDGALLVRPDGFIAWRAKRSKPDAATELESVLLWLLGSAPA
jgi:putative polyketide hydroxylase